MYCKLLVYMKPLFFQMNLRLSWGKYLRVLLCSSRHPKPRGNTWEVRVPFRSVPCRGWCFPCLCLSFFICKMVLMISASWCWEKSARCCVKRIWRLCCWGRRDRAPVRPHNTLGCCGKGTRFSWWTQTFIWGHSLSWPWLCFSPTWFLLRHPRAWWALGCVSCVGQGQTHRGACPPPTYPNSLWN